jgi:hypothetical protein
MAGRGPQTLAVVAGALVALAAAAPAFAHGERAENRTSEATRLAKGLVYRGLVRAPAGTLCAGGFVVQTRKGRDACTHGPDPAPPGRDVRKRRSVAALRLETNRQATEATQTSAAAVEGGAVHCIGDGTSGNRVQAIYAYPAGRASRYADIAPLIKTWAAAVDGVFEASAAETAGERHVRWVTDEACELDVERVQISASARDDFTVMSDELAALGYDDPARKYLVWVDANVYCGIAWLYDDDRKRADNYNNGNPGVSGMVARVDNGCWNYAETHELVHNLGGVQSSAPNASAYGHCTDESDDMCYDDDGTGPVVMRQVCPEEHEPLLDCNHDDYFHTAPPDGNYLATHWNTAESSFLISALVDADAPTLTAPTVRFRSSSGKPSVPLTVSWNGSDAGGIAAYTLFESVDGGAYSPVPLARATATSKIRSALPGHTYRYRVDAVDEFGNAASIDGAPFTLDARQETNGAIAYDGRWSRAYWNAALASYQRRSSDAGASARFAFTGFSVAWVAQKGPTSGRAKVYVDGRYVKTIDLRASSARARRIVFARRWETAAPHTVKVVVVGTAGRPRVDLDAFLVVR